jgi:hypothetical protein
MERMNIRYRRKTKSDVELTGSVNYFFAQRFLTSRGGANGTSPGATDGHEE